MKNSMANSARRPGPGRPKDKQKHVAILEAAKKLFGENGYAGTSMDSVARHASVSKLTVYSHFGDKDNLFRAAVRARCTELLPEELYNPDPSVSAADALLEVAHTHVSLATSQEAAGMWRAIASGCTDRAPQLGTMMWEEGPQRAHDLIKRLLERLVEQRKLQIEDCDMASSQFVALIKTDLDMKRLLQCEGCDEDEFQRSVHATAEAAVKMFVRAYQPA